MTHDRESEAAHTSAHKACWESIPWIVNGALDARRLAQLEPHLRACRMCQEELALHERARTLMRSDDAVTIAPQAGWQKLMQRIDAEDAEAAESPEQRPRQAAPRRAIAWPRWVAIAAAVQGLALALVLGAQYLRTTGAFTAARFETLTSDAPIAASGQVIRLVFEPGVPLNDVSALLRTVDAQIVAGPTEAGVYTIVLEQPQPEQRDIDAALTRLRADPRVVFAEWAVARGAP